jgi:hypothetical protein
VSEQHHPNHPHSRILRFVPSASIADKHAVVDGVANITRINREYAAGLNQEDPYDRIELKRLLRTETTIWG